MIDKNELKYTNKSVEWVISRVHACHGETVTMDPASYVGMMSKALFTHAEFGEWMGKPFHVIRGKSHPTVARQRRDRTMLARYGCIGGRPTPAQEVLERLSTIYPEVTMDVSTYKNCTDKARFIDTEFGEWWAAPNALLFGSKHELRGRIIRKEAFRAKYGVDHPTQNREIRLKQIASAGHVTVTKHWKTGKDVRSTGSYEKAVVDFLNSSRIDYDDQVVLDMPDGKKYFVDFYLPEQDIYVEVKGHFYKDARAKWEWLLSTYPRSQLWDKPKLKSMGLIK